MAETYADDGLVVLAVNAYDDPKTTVESIVKKNKFKQTMLLNGSGVSMLYNVVGLPTTLWVNRKGMIVDFEEGFGGAASLKRKTRNLVNSGE